MKISISTNVGGQWLDKKELRTGDVIKLTTEAKEVESQQGSKQLVAKAVVKGGDKEPKNLSINRPSTLALVQAFGDDTVNWMNKHLGVHVEKTLIAGKRGIALYLIPEGYQVGEDESGFLVVQHKAFSAETPTVEYPENDIRPEDIPF